MLSPSRPNGPSATQIFSFENSAEAANKDITILTPTTTNHKHIYENEYENMIENMTMDDFEKYADQYDCHDSQPICN